MSGNWECIVWAVLTLIFRCGSGKPGRHATVEVPDGLVHVIQLKVDEINNVEDELFDGLRSGEPVVIDSGSFA